MALTTKRIIALPSQTDPQEGDYLAIDNLQGGTHKIPVGRIGVEVDDTLTEQGKAADAKAVGDALDEIRSQIEVTGTASGSIATFADGADMPTKSVIVNIEPKQSGTGTPSPDNERPISGWESVDVKKTGKNLLKVDSVNAIGKGITQTLNEDGTITLSGTSTDLNNGQAINGSAKIVLPAGTYRFVDVGQASAGATFYYYLRVSGNPAWIRSGETFTVPEGSNGCWIILYFPASTTVSGTHGLMIVSENSTYDTYEPYTGNTDEINLGRTVYGGTLDVVSGELTVDKGFATFDGSETWLEYDYNGKKSFRTPVSAMSNNTTLLLSDKFVYADYPWAQSTGYHVGDSSQYIYFQSQDILTVGEWKTWLESNNTTVVYPLATPQTYTLTGQEISTLLGDNNVWADSGDVEVVYVRDLNITINNLLNSNGTRSLGLMMSAPTETTAEEPTEEEPAEDDMR